MLSQEIGDPNSRLTRSKSSDSVGTRRKEPLIPRGVDPEIAQRHALTAAHIAMDRANQRSSIDTNVSYDIPRSHRPSSRAESAPHSHNIRFHDRKQRTLASGPTRHYDTGELSHFSTSNSYMRPVNVGHGQAFDEFGVGTHGSTPSSYRKLRKSRSMIGTRHRMSPIHQFHFHSPSRPQALRRARSTLGIHDQNLRLGLKRSMSFLKLGSGNLGSFMRSQRTSTSHETTADLLSDNSEYEKEHWSATKAKQASILRRKASRIKISEDTERDDSTLYFQPGTNSKFRSLSTTLRDRVRRVLGRSSKDSCLPAQQMQATRAHFRDYLDGAESDHRVEEYVNGNVGNASRSSLYIPSTQHEEGLPDLDTLTRKLRSMHSSESLRSIGQSRLTSWTNSTITNSVGGRSTPIERKRLSIIQEHGGPHQPSSSIGRHLDEVSATHLPAGALYENRALGSEIDSARVYSALVKRIDQEQERGEHQTPIALPEISESSKEQCWPYDLGPQTVSTIRQVTNNTVLSGSSNGSSRSASRLTSFIDRCGTPHRVAHLTETAGKERAGEENVNKALEKSRSFFFPFSSETIFTSPSPFRLALSARRSQQTSSDEDDDSSIIVRRPGRREYQDTSGSRYSRTPSGHILSTESLHPKHEPEDPSAGLPTVIPPRISRFPGPSQSLQSLQKTRATGTDEWKDLISSPLESVGKVSSPPTAHYREAAQIDSDDLSVAAQSSIPLYKLPIPGTSSPTRSPHAQGGGDYYPYRPRASERFPTLDLKEIPANTTATVRGAKQPKRMTSMTRLASAAADLKRVVQGGLGGSKGARGVSDENARIFSARGNRGLEGMVPRKESGEIVSTPGRLQVKMANTSGNNIAAPGTEGRRENANLKPAAIATGARSDTTPPTHGPRALMLSRLSRPFDLTGLSLGPDPASSSAVSSSPGLTVGETALPCCDGADERNTAKERKVGVGVAMSLGRKRMVSDFLRSRRRDTQGKKEVRGGDEEERAFI